MTRMRSLLCLAATVATVVVSLPTAATAAGTTVVVAASPNFLPGSPAAPAVITAGTELAFTTYEYSFHSIMSDERGPDGRLLFGSDATCCIGAVNVTGVASLPPREQPYGFSCLFVPGMRGELIVR